MAVHYNHYTLTFIPGCNKNLYYSKVIFEGSKDEVEQKLFDIVGNSLKICDPFCEYFECFDCKECNEECKCFVNEKCVAFDDEEVLNEKINLHKDFVYGCQCLPNHFRIDEWESKEQFNKKKFLRSMRSKVF
jgi:hypothetical protein